MLVKGRLLIPVLLLSLLAACDTNDMQRSRQCVRDGNTVHREAGTAQCIDDKGKIVGAWPSR